ncbi:MAG: hypothetical protein ABIV43_03745 [Candidatus Saccharimonadales bacterium]
MDHADRLQVALTPDLRRRLEAKASGLGFTSAQAYVRVVIKALVEGRELHFDRPVLEEASRTALKIIESQYYDHMIAELNDELPRFESVDDAIEYICERYRRQQTEIANSAWFEETGGDESFLEG